MSARSQPSGDAGPDSPHCPQPPSPLEERSYVAHDGHIWRKSPHGWVTIDPADPMKLMRLFREDAFRLPHAHPFKAHADKLAGELAEAVAALGEQRHAA